MKTIDVPAPSPLSVDEFLAMAQDEPLIIRMASGEEYVLGALDDFDHEVELMRSNPELMRLLEERSKEPATIPLEALRSRLS